jgi:hypothetical protein
MKKSWILGVLAAIAFLLIPAKAAHAVAIEHDFYPLIDVSFDLIGPSSTETINLAGSLQIDVTFPLLEGSASDGNGNGRDEVPTEMVALSLTGSSSLGPVIVGLDASQPSLGTIEETANNVPGILDIAPFASVGSAESFFDLFLELDIGGSIFRNAVPARIAGVIFHKPVDVDGMESILQSFAPVALVDVTGQATDFTLAGSGRAPEPGTLALFAISLAVLGFKRRRANGS